MKVTRLCKVKPNPEVLRLKASMSRFLNILDRLGDYMDVSKMSTEEIEFILESGIGGRLRQVMIEELSKRKDNEQPNVNKLIASGTEETAK